MAYYTSLIDSILTEVDVLLEEYVTKGYDALSHYLEIPIGTAIVFFFVCYGVALTQGWVKGSLPEFSKSLFKIGFIYYLGMNWGHFSDYIDTFFYDAAGQIGNVLVNASPIKLPTLAGEGINGALQSVFTELMDISEWIIHAGSWTNWMPLIEGVAVGAAGIMLTGFALLEIIIAKCMLSVLFVTAPLFISFTLFKSSYSIFDRWLGACAGYSLLMIFICAGLGIVLALDQWVLAEVYVSKAAEMTAIDASVLVLVTFICFWVLKRISMLAISIGGSITLTSEQGMFASAIGGAVGGFVHVQNFSGILKAPFRFPGNAVIKAKNDASQNTKDALKNLRNDEMSSTKI